MAIFASSFIVDKTLYGYDPAIFKTEVSQAHKIIDAKVFGPCGRLDTECF